MFPKCRLKGYTAHWYLPLHAQSRQLRAGGILTKESVEQATSSPPILVSQVLPYAPGVRRYLAGRRGVAMGHPPGAWDYTEKPRGAAGVWKHAPPLSRPRPGTRTT
jgi:hypothetical protein